MEKEEVMLGVYPYGSNNEDKLNGCELVDETWCEQLNAKVMIFRDQFRQVKIDLFITKRGEVFIGDFYGESMRREDMTFVIMRRSKK